MTKADESVISPLSEGIGGFGVPPIRPNQNLTLRLALAPLSAAWAPNWPA